MLKGVAQACLIDARLCDALFFSHNKAGEELARDCLKQA